MRATSMAAAPLKQAFGGTSSSRLAGPASRRSFATRSRLDASYGFIGLGQMGYPMARNLRKKISESDSLYIQDVNPAVCEQFKKEVGNVEIVESVRQVAENAETILTVLPQPYHVQSVFREMLKPDNLSETTRVKTERLFIDCSTIDPKTSAGVANATASARQGRFVDAPMSGGAVGAAAGRLTFMVGAQPELFPRVEAVLKMMGKRVLLLGPPTSGIKSKLVNNYLLAINNIATCEAMHMGTKWGLDAKQLAEMINTATGKCWPSEVNNPVPGVVESAPSNRDYQPGFGTTLMLKDLDLALQAAAEAKIVTQLGVHAKELYAAVQADERCKDRDFSVVYRYIGGKE